MTAVKSDRKASGSSVGVVEILVWSVLIVSGLGIVGWTFARIAAHLLSG